MPLPPPDQPIDIESYESTWPMGAEKCELLAGEVVWSGTFTEDDLEIARRAFPDRRVVLDEYGYIRLTPTTRD